MDANRIKDLEKVVEIQPNCRNDRYFFIQALFDAERYNDAIKGENMLEVF